MKKAVLVLLLLSFFAGSLFAGETYLVYQERNQTNISIPYSVHVNVVNGEVVNYLIKDSHYTFEFSIENFTLFREALEKFIEWDSIARQNNINESFDRKIPFTASSNNVRYLLWGWSEQNNRDEAAVYKMNDKEMVFEFQYGWRWNSGTRTGRGSLRINSTVARFDIPNRRHNTYQFSAYFDHDRARLFLNNTAEGRILPAIQQSREKERERERKRNLLDELFK